MSTLLYRTKYQHESCRMWDVAVEINTRKLERRKWFIFKKVYSIMCLNGDYFSGCCVIHSSRCCVSLHLGCRWTEPPWPRVGSSAAVPGSGNTPPSLSAWRPKAVALQPDKGHKCYFGTGSDWNCPPRTYHNPEASCCTEVELLNSTDTVPHI